MQTLHDWGNTSSSSIWYETDWIERFGVSGHGFTTCGSSDMYCFFLTLSYNLLEVENMENGYGIFVASYDLMEVSCSFKINLRLILVLSRFFRLYESKKVHQELAG